MAERGARSMEPIHRLAVLGLGLIGGSLARALRRAGVCQEVIGCARHFADLEKALALGVIDHYTTSPAAAVRGADMVVVAAPVAATEAVLREVAELLEPRAVVTDVGSVKRAVIDAARAALGARFPRFVPGHPIAGGERSGVTASSAELFDGRRVVLTPEPETDRDALARVRRMWHATGAEVEDLSAAEHDRLLAATSHLPHLLAYALVASLARRDPAEDVFRLAGSGFRDFSRIAGSNPVLWEEIMLANRDALLEALGGFGAELSSLERALEQGDGPRLREVFALAQRARGDYAARFAPMGAGGGAAPASGEETS